MSTDNPTVNRWLKDKAMDRIDHALGRPVWPLRESHRNHYATCIDSETAKDFDASPFWERIPASGTMAFYGVTDAGRQALANHLETLDVGERRRAYVVTYEGCSRVVPARSRAHARYAEYLTISDCFSELTFGEFIRNSSVRVAS